MCRHVGASTCKTKDDYMFDEIYPCSYFEILLLRIESIGNEHIPQLGSRSLNCLTLFVAR